MHKFNVMNSIVHTANNKIDEHRAWLVPKYWTTPFPSHPGQPQLDEPGSNCISGALFLKHAALMVGIPGTIDTQQYAAKGVTAADAKVAIHLNAADIDKKPRSRIKDGVKEVALHFSGNANNAFEAAVLYTPDKPNAKTFYIPSGVNVPVVYDDKDKVITIFDTFEWAVHNGTTWVKKQNRDIIFTYVTAEGLPLTKLDE